ncbi:MAG: hypothetical protein ABIG85_00945 [Chloroflexota bacterium]
MIVVIGPGALRASPTGAARAVGIAPEIAAAAAAAGAAVEIVTKIGEDGAGEELLLALARAGVGPLAVLRDPARPTALTVEDAEPPDDDVELVQVVLAEAEATTRRPPTGFPSEPPAAPTLEPADLALGLQYLRDYRVVIAVEPLADGGAAVIAEAASFADAGLVVIAAAGLPAPAAYAAATLIEAPAEDPDGAFAGLVGRYAAALDRGTAPAEAFRAATAEGGWEVAAG